MKNILITGISGFAGSFLFEYLLQQGAFNITGSYLSEASLQNIAQKEQVELVCVDLMDKKAVSRLIASREFDMVFHLAALSSIAESFKDPVATVTTNLVAQMNLLEALRATGKTQTRVLIVSSADVYGLVEKNDLPIDEDTPLRPVSPYAVSKIAQDFLGLQYVLSYNMHIIRVRSFNHIGPRQSPYFVVSAFAKKIAEIEKKNLEPRLTVGNLGAKRDFTDVRDIVRSYYLLLDKGKAGGVYNIGSGKAYMISEILEILLSFAKVKISVSVDDTLLRPIDIPELVCNNQKMVKLTGWSPKISLEKSLQDTLDYWRSII